VSALSDPHLHALNSYPDILQVQKYEFDTLADAVPLRYHSGISPTAQGCLKGKTPTFSHMGFDFFNHQAPARIAAVAGSKVTNQQR
jgi:hypothetical protein